MKHTPTPEAVSFDRSPQSLTITLTGRALDNLQRVETALAGRLTIEDIFALCTVADLLLLEEEGGAATFLIEVARRCA